MKQPLEESATKNITDDLTNLQNYARAVARKEFFYNLTSSQITELVKALTEFKKDMPDLKTDKAAGGRYRYQSLPSLLTAISPCLAKYGLCVMQPVHTIATTTYVVTYVLHTSGQYIKSITSLPEKSMLMGKLVTTNESLQAMGGALTYTKRHALKSILCIDADDDTDGNSNGSTFNANN